MGRPTRMARCHPSRKHKARGMCEPCYKRNYSERWRRRHGVVSMAEINRARLDNLRFMVEARVPLEQAVLRAGFPSVSAAERWCLRHHVYHLYAALRHGSHACDYHCPIEWSAR